MKKFVLYIAVAILGIATQILAQDDTSKIGVVKKELRPTSLKKYAEHLFYDFSKDKSIFNPIAFDNRDAIILEIGSILWDDGWNIRSNDDVWNFLNKSDIVFLPEGTQIEVSYFTPEGQYMYLTRPARENEPFARYLEEDSATGVIYEIIYASMDCGQTIRKVIYPNDEPAEEEVAEVIKEEKVERSRKQKKFFDFDNKKLEQPEPVDDYREPTSSYDDYIASTTSYNDEYDYGKEVKPEEHKTYANTKKYSSSGEREVTSSRLHAHYQPNGIPGTGRGNYRRSSYYYGGYYRSNRHGSYRSNRYGGYYTPRKGSGSSSSGRKRRR